MTEVARRKGNPSHEERPGTRSEEANQQQQEEHSVVPPLSSRRWKPLESPTIILRRNEKTHTYASNNVNRSGKYITMTGQCVVQHQPRET